MFLKKKKTHHAALAAVLAAALVSGIGAHASGHAYDDNTLPAEQRAALLLKELTLPEKISLMMDESPEIERLGIPRYGWWNEALHGVGRSGYATVFPQSIGMAAAFDDDMLYRVFDVVSTEARAKFNLAKNDRNAHYRYQGLTFWTPNVNIFRDPRWGRGQETYGEDPYLTSVLGAAAVRGLQGDAAAKYAKTIACAKHYAVHSGPEWNRHSYDAKDIDPRDLWETYLPAFKALVDEGVGQVMCAYNRFEGEPCCSNKRLLVDILRNRWGYDKIVVTDCWAMNDFFHDWGHNTHKGPVEASADAVYSGADLECGPVFSNLNEAVAKGAVTEEAIDKSLMRLLTARFRLGELGDASDSPWNSIGEEEVASESHRQLALDMARKSMTLLKNNGILPLPKDANIVVMGPNAVDSVMQWGNYNGTPRSTVTILDGIKNIATGRVKYLKGCDYVENKNIVSHFDRFRTPKGKGMDARYWNNRDASGDAVAVETLDVPVNKSTGGATVFAPGVSLNDFSAVYKGTFVPDETGEYIMTLTSDRGFKYVKIDGKKVLKPYDESVMKDYVYRFDAEKGKVYDVEVMYSHGEGLAQLRFDIGREAAYDTDCGNADIVVFAGGISPLLEGEEMPVYVEGFKGGDRTTIELPLLQRNLMKELKAKGKKIVFVNCSGSAMGIAPEDSICDAILQAWYPGESGGRAVAEVLYGDYNPAGRLPVTFYKDDLQLPDFEDYDMQGRTYRFMQEKPLYAFGHGLSYTDFDYRKAKLDKKKIKCGESTRLSLDVKNTGSRDGEEVVQIYVHNLADYGINKTLRAFRRVGIGAGETKTLEFDLGPDAFRAFSHDTGEMEVMPGEYEILYGGSSDNLKSLRMVLE